MFRNKSPKKRVRIRAGSGRPIQGGDVSPVYSIDNRRASEFASIAHKPTDIVSAEELWSKFKAAIDSADFFTDNFSSLAVHFSSLADRYFRDDYYFNNYTEFHNNQMTGKRFISYLREEMVFSSGKKFETYEILPLHDEVLVMLKALPADFGLNKSAENSQPEREEDFHERSRWQMVPKQGDIPNEWVELQRTLKPSLTDEDCLGSFAEWIEYMPQGVQYLLIGDTNHKNPDISDWRFNEAPYLEALRQANINDVVIEYPIEANAALQRFFSGDIPDKKALRKELSTVVPKRFAPRELADLAVKAKALGIKIHALDDQLSNLDLKSPRWIFERIANDKLLAEKIKEQVQDRRVAIIYGAGHFKYESSLIEQLGEECCRVVDVFSELEDYKTNAPGGRTSATYVAPYAYILNEYTVIATRGNYLRNISADKDSILCSVRMGLQDIEVRKFLKRVTDSCPCEEKRALYESTAGKVLESIPWWQRALASGFSKNAVLEAVSQPKF